MIHADPSLAIATDALRVAVLLGLATAVAWGMVRTPARMRAVLWVVALAGALMVPFGSRVLSPIDVAVPGWVAEAVWQPVLAPPSDAVFERDRDRGAAGRRGSTVEQGVTAVPDPIVTTTWRLPVALRPSVVATGVWAMGAVLLLLRVAFGSGRIARIVARARPLDDPGWSAALRRASSRVGCRRRVRLLETNELDVPATTGVLRPIVLLPEAAAGWLPDRREVVLMHELVHVRRLDWAWRMVARTVTALHWFDPLAWWAAMRLDREQERACDEAVLRAGVRASSYAAHLLEIARAARPRPLLAVPALELARRTDVEDRIMHVLEMGGWRRSMMAIGIPAVLLVGSLVPAVAAVRPAPQAPERVEPGELPPPPAVDPPRPMAPAPAPDAPPSQPPEDVQRTVPAAPPASPELSELVREMQRLEERIEVPALEVEEAVRERMEANLREIERIEVDLDAARLAELESRIRAETERIGELDVDLEPIQAEIGTVSEQISALELDASLNPDALRAQIEPHVARLEELHAQLAPVHDRMADLHVSLEPMLAEIESIHAEMELDHEQMEQLHAELEPLHAEVERLHESMEPIREELERTAERLDAAVTREVESAIREQLRPVVGEDAPWNEAAQRIVDVSHVTVHDDLLRVEAPPGETRTILRDLLSPHRRVDPEAFDAALDRTVQELHPLVRSVSPP